MPLERKKKPKHFITHYVNDEHEVKARIIKEITGKERYKLYCAAEILDILEV